MERTYIAIDLKSFYASVECVDRGLDPLTTHLAVADESRTEKTICLAVTPSLKAYGIPSRARLFEVNQKIREVNSQRLQKAPGKQFSGTSYLAKDLQEHPELALDTIIAPPRMAYYMEYSSRIYQTYLRYIAPEDIHVYSIDEVFMDVTHYLRTYGLTARELAMKMILDVLHTTGITATAGIAENLFLCKVAMDIQAKHIPADTNGVRIAQLDEMTYRQTFWTHRPLTDFWRVGAGTARRLESHGMYTMGDVARRSLEDEETLYKLLGVNAELLIDHAWGWEPTTIADIKGYKPASHSLGTAQVLQDPYTPDKAKLVLLEMADLLVLDLVEKGLVTKELFIQIGYDAENLTQPDILRQYHGEVVTDPYGRKLPKPSHRTIRLQGYTSSTKAILQKVGAAFDSMVHPHLSIRRLGISANQIIREASLPQADAPVQLDFFTDWDAKEAAKQEDAARLQKERKQQEAILQIKKKFGKNAILKGMNLEEGATAKARNEQIGGHKA